MKKRDKRLFDFAVFFLLFAPFFRLFGAQTVSAQLKPLRVAVDLSVGESTRVTLNNGSRVNIRLLETGATPDLLSGAIASSWVRVDVDGENVLLESANYNLPVTVKNVQIDCPITRSVYATSHRDMWRLEKDARLRIWPADSPYIRPGTFVYPVKQKWFASKTQMSNEPVYVDGGSYPRKDTYYHDGLDFGGAEGLVEIVSATDGTVLSAGDSLLPGYEDSPVSTRYDVVYIQDDRGWILRYSHLWAFHLAIRPGERVKMGQKIGILGKEGGSGGWSHLHFGITARQPSGEWGTEEGYVYVWQAYREQYDPPVIAVARPHRYVRAGQEITLSGKKSCCFAGEIQHYQWQLSDGRAVSGAEQEISYDTPGQYCEILKVTCDQGQFDYDFAVVTVIDTTEAPPLRIPPRIHAVYFPTFDIDVDDPVTFLVRSFDTGAGEETFDFGDGSEPVTVRSNAGYNANVLQLLGLDDSLRKQEHHLEGYARTVHRFKNPGHYLVKASHTAENGYTATDYLHVQVGE